MFVDASAIVAVIAREPGCERLIDALQGPGPRHTSGVAVFEAVMALNRIRPDTVEATERLVHAFLDAGGIVPIPIDADETAAAVEAHARYGKGRHPARLNLGDCFAYACAKVHGVPLLFVGDDFPQTDIRAALT
jgi:ribonuclease VapC